MSTGATEAAEPQALAAGTVPRAAGVIAIGTGASRALGLFRDVLIAA